MQKYKTMIDFPAESGAIPVLNSVVTAIPYFFPIILFVIWILGSGGAYYAILKTTGKKRFWACLTSMSFISYLLSLIIASMNNTVEYLNGYWVRFYILMTLGSFFLLTHYK